MNKTFLTLSLGFMPLVMAEADHTAQANRLNQAIAELEAIGKRPSASKKDVADFRAARNALDKIMEETDDLVVEQALYRLACQAVKDYDAHYENAAHMALKKSKARYYNMVAVHIEEYNQLKALLIPGDEQSYENVRAYLLADDSFCPACLLWETKEDFDRTKEGLKTYVAQSHTGWPGPQCILGILLMTVNDTSRETLVKIALMGLEEAHA